MNSPGEGKCRIPVTEWEAGDLFESNLKTLFMIIEIEASGKDGYDVTWYDIEDKRILEITCFYDRNTVVDMYLVSKGSSGE